MEGLTFLTPPRYLVSLQQKLASLERTEENGSEGDSDTHAPFPSNIQLDHGNGNQPPIHDDALSAANSGGSVSDPALLPEPLSDADIAHSDGQSAQDLLFRGTAKQNAQPSAEASDVGSLTNPLSAGPSAFMTSTSGRTCKFTIRKRHKSRILTLLVVYLGTSSNWSFTRRVLSITHENVHQSPIPSSTLLFDGETYDLKLTDDKTPKPAETSAVPTVDYALHLVNSVKFHCGQLFHLFEEDSFMRNLHDFYSEPKQDTTRTDLWYIHFLLILAFGKAFVTKTSRGKRPPGANFFCKAIEILPDTSVLWKEPVESTEILCCIAMYFQCIDHRSSAYNYVSYLPETKIFLC